MPLSTNLAGNIQIRKYLVGNTVGKNISPNPFYLKCKINVNIVNNFSTSFAKIDQIHAKNTQNVTKTTEVRVTFTKL